MKNIFQRENEIAGSIIIVKLKAGALLKAGRKRLFRLSRNISVKNLFFTVSTQQIEKIIKHAKKKDPLYCSNELSSFFFIPCGVDSDIQQTLKKLQLHADVDFAYTEWQVQPPLVAPAKECLDTNQGYLYPAPVGINAACAWRHNGGKGGGSVKFIDIELGWNLGHEGIHAGRLECTGENVFQFREHGTAVLGIILMRDTSGIATGIAPEVSAKVVSQCRVCGYVNTADAVLAAIVHLRAGDILLLEAQATETANAKGYGPVEIHMATYEAIRLATALGIIVIEAAGNGCIASGKGRSLNTYRDINGNRRLNRLDRNFSDSGAIVVGAACSAVPHERISFSNYGNRVDCYAWGENIVTAGSFPESSGVAVNTYTAAFGGTSGAAAIIAGVAIAIQGIAMTTYKRRLTPAQMRALLSDYRNNTSSANGKEADKIGVMPDLKKIIKYGLPQILGKTNRRP